MNSRISACSRGCSPTRDATAIRGSDGHLRGLARGELGELYPVAHWRRPLARHRAPGRNHASPAPVVSSGRRRSGERDARRSRAAPRARSIAPRPGSALRGARAGRRPTAPPSRRARRVDPVAPRQSHDVLDRSKPVDAGAAWRRRGSARLSASDSRALAERGLEAPFERLAKQSRLASRHDVDLRREPGVDRELLQKRRQTACTVPRCASGRRCARSYAPFSTSVRRMRAASSPAAFRCRSPRRAPRDRSRGRPARSPRSTSSVSRCVFPLPALAPTSVRRAAVFPRALMTGPPTVVRRARRTRSTRTRRLLGSRGAVRAPPGGRPSPGGTESSPHAGDRDAARRSARSTDRAVRSSLAQVSAIEGPAIGATRANGAPAVAMSSPRPSEK